MYFADNPFAPASRRGIVERNSFIGRQNLLEEIENRIVRPEGQRGSLAIIGVPDVGKRCLINTALLEGKEELSQRKLVPIEIDLKTYVEADKPDKFFRDLVSTCCDELEDLELATPKILAIAERVLEEWDKRGGTISLLKRFFKNVLRAGVHVIFVLDNFDHADSLFKGNVAHIHWLRHLTEGDLQVSWVVLACKPISEIEPVPKSLSHDMFDERYLGMFTDEDVTVYFHTLAQMGVTLSEEQKGTIKFYCGRHPYLLSLLGYQLVEEYVSQPGEVDVHRAFQQVEERFHRSYDRIFDLILVHDGNDAKLQKLWHILCDASEVERKDINRMLAYGLIYPNPASSPAQKNTQPTYTAFSEHFQQYLFVRMAENEAQSIDERLEQMYGFADSHQTMLPGQVLRDRYEIHNELKTTGHSQVVKAWDTQLERYVAIKQSYLDPAYSDETVKRYQEVLEREAKILAGIRHPNLGVIHDVIRERSSIIMEWIEGKSFDQVWERGTGLPVLQVVKIGMKLASALEYLHTGKQQIIHRDIKPENILLRDDGEPILIDFDVARAARVGTIIPSDERGQAPFIGTPHYSAPEQRENAANAGPPADIYALGVVLYEALTGGEKEALLSSHLLREQPPDARIPLAFWHVIYSMLQDDPLQRPVAQDLCQELERCYLAVSSANRKVP